MRSKSESTMPTCGTNSIATPVRGARMKDQGGDGGAEGAPRCRNLGQPQPADDSGAHGPHRRKGKPDGRGAKAFARRGIARQGRSSDTVPALEVKDVRRLGNERGMGGGRKEPPGTRTQDREGGGLRRRMWGLRSPGRGAEVAPRRRIPPAPPRKPMDRSRRAAVGRTTSSQAEAVYALHRDWEIAGRGLPHVRQSSTAMARPTLNLSRHIVWTLRAKGRRQG